uniref:N1311 protein n=1 Tax=Saccharomyces cerevisiae TaxID=4932 RepID=A2NXP5_YEASX|nr:N1311 [Saccharomyces cerevisiae]
MGYFIVKSMCCTPGWIFSHNIQNKLIFLICKRSFIVGGQSASRNHGPLCLKRCIPLICCLRVVVLCQKIIVFVVDVAIIIIGGIFLRLFDLDQVIVPSACD